MEDLDSEYDGLDRESPCRRWAKLRDLVERDESEDLTDTDLGEVHRLALESCEETLGELDSMDQDFSEDE